MVFSPIYKNKTLNIWIKLFHHFERINLSQKKLAKDKNKCIFCSNNKLLFNFGKPVVARIKYFFDSLARINSYAFAKLHVEVFVIF